MRINNNISALNAWRGLTNTDNSLSKSLEKLSSGLRINRAGDDAAGLAISEKMRGQIRGLNMAVRNAQDGISLIQTAEGALNETHSILQRMRELTVQGANDTLQDTDRAAIDTELTELNSELNRISTTTKFNQKALLDGTFGVGLSDTGSLKVGVDGVSSISVSGAKQSETYTISNSAANTVTLTDSKGNVQVLDASGASFTGALHFDKLGVTVEVQDVDLSGTDWTGGAKTIITTAEADQMLQIGANKGESLGLSLGDMSATALVVDSISVANAATAGEAIDALESAIGKVAEQRSKLGAWQNRLEHTIKNLGVAAENLSAAESRIRDVDMAAEMMNFTKQNILMQAGTAMLAQANARPQSVLQLLG